MQGMQNKLVLLAAALLAGSGAGFLLRGFVEPRESLEGRGSDRERELEGRLGIQVARSREMEEAYRQQIEDLTRRLGEAEAERVQASASAATGQPAVSPPRRWAPGVPQLASVDEADALFEDSMKRFDLAALWQLGAALLGMGEPGYEKLMELLTRFVEDAGQDDGFRPWLQNEIMMGRFLRAVADNHENLLRFAVYLNAKDPETLPEAARHVKRGLTGEVAPLILGFYHGEDPEIERGFLSMYQRKLDESMLGDPTRANLADARQAIQCLAQLRSDAATDTLVGLVDRIPPSVAPELVSAIAFQGNPRAIPALESLRSATKDEQLAKLIDVALQRLR